MERLAPGPFEPLRPNGPGDQDAGTVDPMKAQLVFGAFHVLEGG